MPKKVPYLEEEQIERDTAALLAEFAQARSVALTLPIRIEDIVEKHLKLGVEFDDMHRLLNHPRSGVDPDILGAIWFDERRIVIDESLDPEENSSKEGRYRFTLAHQGGGHWRLHRHLFAHGPGQASLFNGPTAPSFICRSSQGKEPVEWQADFYASCLLMPRKLLIAAWDEIFPDRKPRVLQPHTPIDHPLKSRVSCSEPAVRTAPRPRTRCWTISRVRWLRSSSFHLSQCASDWRSSVCYIARSPVSVSLWAGHKLPFFWKM
jgi:hypothetical protein